MANPRGGPGIPLGFLKGATLEAQKFCFDLVKDPQYQHNLKQRMRNGTVHPLVEKMVWAYAAGEPVARQELTVNDVNATPQSELQKLSEQDLLDRAQLLSENARRLIAMKQEAERTEQISIAEVSQPEPGVH